MLSEGKLLTAELRFGELFKYFPRSAILDKLLSSNIKYELFKDGKPCDAALPVNSIKDEFTIVRFGALLAKGQNKPAPVVLPRDVVNPKLMGRVLHDFKKLPYKVDLLTIRGGLSLNPEWKEWAAPPPSEIKKVTIPDRNRFISDPKVEVDGRIYKVELTRANIEELMTFGTTVVVVGIEDDSTKIIELSSNLPALDGNTELAKDTVHVSDLYEFLSKQKISIGSYGNYQVSLTERNVEELSTVGITRVELSSGEGQRNIYVTAASSKPATGYTLSALSTEDMVESTRHGSPIYYDKVDLFLEAVPMLPSNFEFVLLLPYRQTWELLGYSRGELLNSISLGPQEETTIEIFTWNRLKRSREDTLTIEQEGTLEVAFTDKDSMETIREMTKASNWKFDGGGNVTIPKVNVNLNANFETGASLDEVNKNTHQAISEAVRKASARIKTSRQTKVTESEELGREEKVTRKIKNPNMCRTLNLDYFDILASYKVTTQLLLNEVQLCVLVDEFLPKNIDRHFVMCYEGALRDALMFPKTYERGFDAARMLAAWKKLCTIKCISCPCEKLPIQKPSTQLPPAAGGAGTSNSPVEIAKNAVAGAARFLGGRIAAMENATPNQICGLANDVARWGRYVLPSWVPGAMSSVERKQYEDEWQQAKVRYHRWLYRKIPMELLSGRFWNAALEFKNGNDVTPEALERIISAADPSILADLFNLALMSVRAHAKAIEIITEILANLCYNLKPLVDNIGFDDSGLGTAFSQARSALDTYKAALTAQSQSSGDRLGNEDVKREETEDIIEKAVPDYTPKEIAEAEVAEEQLLCHIQKNESYYRQAIWRRLDYNDRLAALSTIGNLSDYVNNEVVGFVGKKAALPFRTKENANVSQWFQANVISNSGLGSTRSDVTITLPTSGVIMETRLGQCDSCEDFIMKHRELDLKQKESQVKVNEERAKQEELETKRYEKRLNLTPNPMLDDPDPNQDANVLKIRIEKEKEKES